MEFGICNLSIVPVRREPSDTSEMVTQLLFGDHFTVLDQKEQWVNIRVAFDDYTGWVDEKQFIKVAKEEFDLLNDISYITLNVNENVCFEREDYFQICLGSVLPDYNGSVGKIGDRTYQYDGHSIKIGELSIEDKLKKVCMNYMHAPYLWGGKTPFGIDCSGFTQMVYKQFGIFLKRDAWQQADQGNEIKSLNASDCGDLAFFSKNGKITHVGILLNDEKIMHASGKVRIDDFNEKGIYNQEKKETTHLLHSIKRLGND